MGEPAKKQDEAAPTANDNAQPRWLNSKQAAERIGLKPAGLKSLVFRGKIKPDHRGGRGVLRGHRFLAETLDAYLKDKE